MPDELNDIMKNFYGRDDFMLMLFGSINVIWLGAYSSDMPKEMVSFFLKLLELTYHRIENPIELSIPEGRSREEFLSDLENWIKHTNLFVNKKYGGSVAYKDMMLFLYQVKDALED